MPYSIGPHTYVACNAVAWAGGCLAEGFVGGGFCGKSSRGDASRGGARRYEGRQPRASALAERRLAHELHSRHSHRVMIGLLGLLALCAEASGKARGTEQWLADIQAKIRSADREPHTVLRAFGARSLPCSAAPQLYAVLLDICIRAGIKRVPELFLLPASGMNAFALGAPENACISVTQRLLHGLSREEVASILAHEVAHILHHDTSAMTWAAAIEGEIATSALRGIAGLMTRRKDFVRAGPQALLLAVAPAVARLLFFALSRVRELAADAMALDLIDDPKALAAALSKLEYFHTGRSPLHAHLQDNAHAVSLRSHPGTWERISQLA